MYMGFYLKLKCSYCKQVTKRCTCNNITRYNHVSVWFQENSIVTGCADGLIRMFNAKTGRLIKQFREHVGGVEKLQVDSERIVSTGIDK